MKDLPQLAAFLLFACGLAAAQTTTGNSLEKARVFDYDQMQVRTAPNGTEYRAAFNGTLPTGESVGAHESMQPAGTAPPQLHKNQHSEFIVVQQGTVEYTHDGKAERADIVDRRKPDRRRIPGDETDPLVCPEDRCSGQDIEGAGVGLTPDNRPRDRVQ